MQAIYETDTDSHTSFEETNVKPKDFYKNKRPNGMFVQKLIEKCEELSLETACTDVSTTKSNVSTRAEFCCKLCNRNDTNESYVILSCNHVFHIKCLVETHFQEVYKYPIIDQEYFSHRCCSVCSEPLQQEELMYLHGKFLSNTKQSITKHQTSINALETQLRRIKDELRTCYEYKHRLEQQREKSKQIVSILSTMNLDTELY